MKLIFYDSLYLINAERLGEADIGAFILQLFQRVREAAHTDDICTGLMRLYEFADF
jgi:hypothetical protein